MHIVEMYQTDDGKVFKTESEAVRHEAVQQFIKWYDHNYLVGRNGNMVIVEGVFLGLFLYKLTFLRYAYSKDTNTINYRREV